jgi:hypothetical protein
MTSSAPEASFSSFGSFGILAAFSKGSKYIKFAGEVTQSGKAVDDFGVRPFTAVPYSDLRNPFLKGLICLVTTSRLHSCLEIDCLQFWPPWHERGVT